MTLPAFVDAARRYAGTGDCVSAVLDMVPAARKVAQEFRALAPAARRAFLATADVPGVAASVAARLSLARTRTAAGVPAWGVAIVPGASSRGTFVFWDGRGLWAQGARGAARVPVRYLVAVWSC